MRNGIFLTLFYLLLLACTAKESERFTPPQILSASADVQEDATVTLRCNLSGTRVESCGFLYGEGEKLDHSIAGAISGDGFEATVTGLSRGKSYSWCAYIAAGEAEFRSGTDVFSIAKEEAIQVEDKGFLKYLLSEWDTDADGEISLTEASAISCIDIFSEDWDILSLKGIEFMENLVSIRCNGRFENGSPSGTLQQVDVSANSKLRTLDISNCPGAGSVSKILDLRENLELESLNCEYCEFEFIDLSGCPKLQVLRAENNELSSLDLSRNKKLSNLNCSSNFLYQLAVSGLPQLTELYCKDNPLSSIILQRNAKLRKLDISGTQIKSLDLSGNPELTSLTINGIDGFSSPDLQYCPKLEQLSLKNDGLTSLNIGNNPELRYLNCEGNLIEVLDVSKNLFIGEASTEEGKENGLWCVQSSPNGGISLLKCLYVADGQHIPYITEDRSESHIAANTHIIVLGQTNGEYPDANQMWYVTVSGKPIDMTHRRASEFSNIVSNVYEGDKGVMTFDSPLTEFSVDAFRECADLLEVVIPPMVQETAYSCFRECDELRRVVFSPGIIIVGDSSFHNCRYLSEIYLPDTVTEIAKDAFSHAYILEHIDLPPYLERLGQSAFLNCYKLDNVVLPASVKFIGMYAFNNCSLTSFTCLAPEPPTLDIDVFDPDPQFPIYVPAASVELYRQQWAKYANCIRAIE